MKRFSKIGALVMASMITGVVLSGCGNNSNANGGSQVENPFAQNSITVSEGSQTASDASQTESVDNPSVPQTSASSDTAPQSSLSAEPSIREVMDASGGVSALSGMFESFTPESMTVSAEYGTKNNFDLAANHGTERYDFIFASKTITVKAYGQLQSAYFTQESDGTYKRRQLSTHFPVMAKVKLP